MTACGACGRDLVRLGTPDRDRTPTFGCVTPSCERAVRLAASSGEPATLERLTDANGRVSYLVERGDSAGPTRKARFG